MRLQISHKYSREHLKMLVSQNRVCMKKFWAQKVPDTGEGKDSTGNLPELN